MIIGKIRRAYERQWFNRLSYKTDRKIIVFESDDWGAIRMPDRNTFDKVCRLGLHPELNKYESLDSLESIDDINHFADTVHKIECNTDLKPKFTFNYVTCNADFEKIIANKYNEYVFEPTTLTYQRYYGNDMVIKSLKALQEEGIINIQFHAREHFNVPLWLSCLHNDSYQLRELAKIGMIGSHYIDKRGNFFVRAYDASQKQDIEYYKESISEGLELFHKTFGFRSKTAIAPNYLWDVELEDTYKEGGVALLQGGRRQNFSRIKHGSLKHYTGQKAHGLIYIVRNCQFEPFQLGNNAIQRCLFEIENSFDKGIPAIVCSHRVNYIGKLSSENRDGNLRRLEVLFSEIKKRWPDAEFLTSDQMIDLFK